MTLNGRYVHITFFDVMIEPKSYTMNFFGVTIDFPHENPYGAQKGMILKSLQAYLNFGNALLESPTGTGKSLALLAAALAYQRHIGSHPILPPAKRDPYIHHLHELQEPTATFVPASAVKTADELYKCNVPLERSSVPVWYTTRTHTQVKQLVGELRKLPYHPQLTILAARKRICLFPKVRDSGDADGACVRARAKKQCPYEKVKGVPVELQPYGRLEKFDLEDLLEYCEPRMICPYFLSREIMKKADLVLSTYNIVLNPKVKGQMMLSILGTILIIDEAHNVESTIRESLSFVHHRSELVEIVTHLNSFIISQAGTELELHLTRVREMYSMYLQYLHGKTVTMRAKKCTEWIEKDNLKFFNALGLTPENWFDFRVTLDYVFVAFNGGINKDTKERIHIPMIVGHLLEQLYVVMALCFKQHMKYMDAFKIVVQLGDTLEEDKILAMSVNPGAYFSTIADEVNSVVLSSGTLNPIHQLSVELGTSFKYKMTGAHVIGPNQLAAFTIKESSTGVALSSAYAFLKETRVQVERGLGEILLELLPVIPGGVLFFVPSHEFLDSLLNTWDRDGTLEKITAIKPFYRETKELKSDVYDEYKKSIKESNGAFLIGVFRGKMSEGIDFYNEQSRAVFAFGIPYAPPNELEVRLKKEYNDTKCVGLSDAERGMNGREWYDAQAFRALFQATGRCIRHARDYGAVLLIDSRFAGKADLFPHWMKESFQYDVPIAEVRSKLQKFYREMMEAFPVTHPMDTSTNLTLLCVNCEAELMEVQQLDSIDCFSSACRPNLAELLECSPDDSLALFRPQDHTGLRSDAHVEEIVWCDPDCSGYSPIKCICGATVGAVMSVGKLDEADILDATFLVTTRAVAAQNDIIEPLDKIMAPKANRKMTFKGRGQTRIVYIEHEVSDDKPSHKSG